MSNDPFAPRTGAPTKQKSKTAFTIEATRKPRGQRVLLYGPGKVGKSSTCALAPKPLFVNIEDGLHEIDAQGVTVESFADALAICDEAELLAPFATIVFDSITKLEELCVEDVVVNVATEQGRRASSIEDYGYGKGWTFVSERWRRFLQAVHDLSFNGKHVVLIAHDVDEVVKNPMGEDFRQKQPRLQDGKNTSVRRRTREEVDHLVFMGNESVIKRGKETAAQRMFYLREQPGLWAGTRNQSAPEYLIASPGDATLWQTLIGA